MRILNSPALGIALGAACGSVLRAELLFVLPGLWTLAFINVLGSFLMGRLAPPAWLGTGFLGGFTSFSTFTALLTSTDSPFVAGFYLAGTTAGCVCAWLMGSALRQRT
ncbi:CrcB family protein [Corynebacterium pseudopelargi]|uniref:Fluoride-specific ion channel FluC n=1 Tax=Corynebacterium pseudopelargi TaxID=2080757 RepID=A0A3G6IWV2_9CORY|nr:CrcB family protein [Corynebacterium pseudopelargi]AZA08580.1 camphor resistance protein CrcB [Corynebacterium pseudopelargi]